MSLIAMRAVFALVLCAAACSAGSPSDASSVASITSRHVPAEQIARGAARRVVDKGLIGVVVAHESVDLVAKGNGRIKEILVRLGDKVSRDVVVARLDAQAARQDLAMAEASLRAAEAELDKVTVEAGQAKEKAARRSPEAANGEHLFSGEEVSDARYQDKLSGPRMMTARATVDERAARVKQLRATLSDLDLRAPFDGTVSVRYVDSGAVVGPTTPIMRIISPDDLWVRFAVPEDRAVGIVAGRRLSVVIETMTDLVAVVEKVAPEVDAASRMIVAEAKLELPAPARSGIRPGLAARVFPEREAGERAPKSVSRSPTVSAPQ